MKIKQFLEHHGVVTNPFAEEDAQNDAVFKEHCISSAFHPSWDKIYGDPTNPATALIFGEKGSGKTANRLQIVKHLGDFNRSHPAARIFVIEYDDFNPFLDRFRDRLVSRRRRPDRVMKEWKLWDHMDSILTIGVTSLVDRILDVNTPTGPDINTIGENDAARLDRHQSRDLLLLAACYDQSASETFKGRWHRLRRKLKFSIWRSRMDVTVGCATTIAVFALLASLEKWNWLEHVWVYLLVIAGWLPWAWRLLSRTRKALGVFRHLRSGNIQLGALRQVLMNFTEAEVNGQPLPNRDRTDDRYELLSKFQGILSSLRFGGIVVLVDRLDEPHLINGSAEQMRAFLWSMLDNKFLKQPGIGLKMLLPIELVPYIEREDRDFFQRARLDKQNMIPSLEWTGESLLDLANARIQACSKGETTPTLRALLDESISNDRIVAAIRSLRVPRHLFKFLYRLFVAHCNAHSETSPCWKISSEMFESVLAVFSREQEAVDRGLRAG